MKTLIIGFTIGIALFAAIEVILRFDELGVWKKLSIDVASWLDVHAEWKEDWNGKSHICSACKCDALFNRFGDEEESLYCPRCGARMRR